MNIQTEVETLNNEILSFINLDGISLNVSSDEVYRCTSCSGGCESGNNWSPDDY